MPSAHSLPMVAAGIPNEKKRAGTKTFRPFSYVSSHAVTGRLACLSVVPAPVIFKVTPRPE
jgi:hypothetical protein